MVTAAGEVKVPDVAGHTGQLRCIGRRANSPDSDNLKEHEAGRELVHLTVSPNFVGCGRGLLGHSSLEVMAEVNIRQEEHEQISTSVEVEQLDTNLFRSKSLWLPIRARGVYGGQVISQALVSATNCVSPDYALHVSASG